MHPLTIFVGGFIIGWAAEWQFFSRRKERDNQHLNDRLATAQAELDTLKTQREEWEAMSSQSVAVNSRDQLDQIRGIGPVFARRLNAEGIFTFADLAKLSPERIREIVSDGSRFTNIDSEDWIAQARRLAAGC